MKNSNSTAGKTARKVGRPVSKENARVKPLYPVSRLSKYASKQLWVAYPTSNPSNGLVYSSSLSRDKVRNATAKLNGASIQSISACRVSFYNRNHK